MDWYNDKFLPSLFDRWEGRNKQYPAIIITEAQAHQCRVRMKQVTNFSEFYGKSRVVGMECEWRGRRVFLQQRGRYTFLSFGLTTEETAEAAETEAERQHQRRLESLRRMREKASPRLAKYEAEAVKRLADAVADLEDEDVEEWEIDILETRKRRATEELEVIRA